MKDKDKKIKQHSDFKEFFAHFGSWIIFITAAVILLLGVFFVLRPKYNEVKISGALNLEAKNTELAGKEKYLADLKELQKNYQNINDRNISRMNLALPTEDDIAGLFVQLEDLSKTSGFNLLAVDVNPLGEFNTGIKTNGMLKELNVTLTIEGGNYSALKNFLRETENNLRLFDVKSLNFSSGSNLYALNFSTYYYKSQ